MVPGGSKFHLEPVTIVSSPRIPNKNPTEDVILQNKQEMVQDYAKDKGIKRTMGLQLHLDF